MNKNLEVYEYTNEQGKYYCEIKNDTHHVFKRIIWVGDELAEEFQISDNASGYTKAFSFTDINEAFKVQNHFEQQYKKGLYNGK